MTNQAYYTVLCEVRAHKIEYKGIQYAKGDYILIPRQFALQYGDALRILTRSEQLHKEREWEHDPSY